MIPGETGTHAAFASDSPRPRRAVVPQRPGRARRTAALARLLIAPLAVVAAALAGVIFVVLLPVCGIATIAEGLARASWRYVRRSDAGRDAR